MSRLTIIAAIMLILCSGTVSAAPKTTSSIAVDLGTGEIIASERPDVLREPASLTKLMTLYLTFEAIEKGRLKMDSELKVSRTAANRSPSRLDVRAGQTIKTEDAVKALIVKSANDCATVLAEALAEDERKFAVMMTEKAKKLGMKNTVFKNASGLNNRQQLTTARDMAVLAGALYKHFPQYYHLFSLKEFTYQGKTFYTHNHVLKKFKGADGMKTGYISTAGFNIVTSAERNGSRILAVTMGHKTLKDRDTKVMRLMDKGLQKIALNKTGNPEKVLAKLEVPQLIATEKMSGKALKKAIAKGQWGVQVGAFRNYAKARSYAFGLKQKMPEIKPYPVDVEAAESEMAVVYRAKLTNFSKKDAEELCNRLKKENKSCIVISTKDESQLTLAEK